MLSPSATPLRTRLLASAVVFLIALGVLLPVFFSLPVLYDTDSYYHLAAARAYAAPGHLDGLPWARFSLLRDGFGDKDFLFHAFLVPFVTTFEPTDGGRVALALLGAAIAALLCWAGMGAAGPWGGLLPLFLVLTSPEWDWRLVRLRPELLALVLLLLALLAAGARRYRLLGLVTLLFTLAYTAFHALLGLCGILFLWRGLVRGRWEWGLVVYPTLGAGLGLVIHPQFPANLAIWWVQNVDFFRYKDVLDVGTEIFSQPADEVLLHSLGWWLGLVLLVLAASRRRATPPEGEAEAAQGRAEAFGVGAVVFGILYLLMRRMILYFVPFASLALLYGLRSRGWVPGGSIPLGRRLRLPLAAGLAISVLATLPWSASLATALAAPAQRAAGPRAREAAWRELGRAMPVGARVAATFGSAQVYMLFAPQARYLNVLDPIFMALPYPHAYAVQRDVFAGREADVPLASEAALDSDYLAYSKVVESPLLTRRLAADPRVETRFDGIDRLVHFVPGRGAGFVLDWEVRPAGADGPWRPYPRVEDAALRGLEGYVDVRRVAAGPIRGCVDFRRSLAVAAPTTLRLELAPYGPSILSLDGAAVASVEGDLLAVLGEGLTLPLGLAAGEHEMRVRTCPARSEPEQAGFYLVEHGSAGAS